MKTHRLLNPKPPGANLFCQPGTALQLLGLFTAGALLAGCCAAPKGAQKAGWHTNPPAKVSATPSPDGRAVSILFTGLEIHATNAVMPALQAGSRLLISPIDAEAKDARLDFRGAAMLSRGARAQCRVEWNGTLVHLSQLPCDDIFGVTNQSWTCYLYIPRKDIRPSSPNQLTIKLPLTAGSDPTIDFLTLDSVDINWQTNREPAQP